MVHDMTGKIFMNAVVNGKIDILEIFLQILKAIGSPYCVVGGLAVNAYGEPVVSLDLDMVVAMDDIGEVCKTAKSRGLKVKKFEHSVNVTSPKSDLRIQLQMDERYQEFIKVAPENPVLWTGMKGASAKGR
jgi:hypothetical protein